MIRRPVPRATLALALSCALAPAAGLHAQPRSSAPSQQNPLVIPRIHGQIALDGRMDEPAWDDALVLHPVMHVPDFEAEPSERTEFRIAHDGTHLYFACFAWDSNPDGIRAPSLRRDDGSFANDWCALNLDTFNDEENTLAFATSPAGIRTDLAVSGDGTPPGNFDWNAFWDVAVSRDGEGWYAEFRIPLSSLRFQVENGRVVMGMTVWRNIARKNERVTYPPISPQWGIYSPFKASQMRKIQLEGVERGEPFYVTPYGLVGGGYDHTLEPGGYQRARSTVREIGADLKHAITPNLTLDLTLNTDFAQVEADDQQVNLSRFSLFFPEKRQFFQERASVFDFSLGGNERLFHSRRVGLVGGEPVRIYGGARLVGRVGEWDVGFLDMQTAAHGEVPSENLGVLRLRRRVLNPNSYLGGIVTSRVSTEGERNVVAGADALLRLFGQDFLTVNAASSFGGEGAAPGAGSTGALARSLLRVHWERRGLDGPVYAAGLTRVGAAFEPDLGFLLRRDYVRGEGMLGYGWRPGEAAVLLRHGVAAEGTIHRRNRDGSVESAEVGPRWVLETRGGHRWTVRAPFRYEDLDETFRLSDEAAVPAGSYRFGGVALEQVLPPSARVQGTLRVEAGSFYDGRRTSASASSTWRASRHLRFDGTYQFDRVEFSERQERFTAHVMRLRTEVMATTALSAVVFAQHNTVGRALVFNFRLRYNPREGNDLYLVVNEGRVTDPLAFDPVRPRGDRRTLLVKYARTVRLGG